MTTIAPGTSINGWVLPADYLNPQRPASSGPIDQSSGNSSYWSDPNTMYKFAHPETWGMSPQDWALWQSMSDPAQQQKPNSPGQAAAWAAAENHPGRAQGLDADPNSAKRTYLMNKYAPTGYGQYIDWLGNGGARNSYGPTGVQVGSVSQGWLSLAQMASLGLSAYLAPAAAAADGAVATGEAGATAAGTAAGTAGAVADAGTALGDAVGTGLSIGAPDAISMAAPTFTSAASGIGAYMPANMIGSALQDAGMPGWAASGIGGAVQGAGTSALAGGNIGQGALMGGIGGSFGNGGVGQGITNGVSNAVGGGTFGNILGSAVTGAIGSGLGAAATGGDPLKAAEMGGLTSGAGSSLNAGLNASGINSALNNAIGGYGTSIVDSALGGALRGTITGQGAGAGAMSAGLNTGINGAINNAPNWWNNLTSGGSQSSSGPALQNTLDFSSSMPTAADLQNPNIDLSGSMPNYSFPSGNNMSSTDPFAFDPYVFDTLPTVTAGATPDPNSFNFDMSQYQSPYTTPDFSSSMPTQADLSGINLSSLDLGNIPSQISTAVAGGANPATSSWWSRLLGQIGVGSQAGSHSLSPLQQVAGLAGLAGVLGSALGGSNTNQTPNYQSIPGSAISSYGSGGTGGGGFNWTNYGYQPRVQNPAMQNPNIDWSHYGELSQAQKPGGGVFFTPAAGAPVNAAFGPSQQQVPGYAAGGSIAPLQQLASMAPQVAMQNHVSNMNPPQPVMGPQPGQMQVGAQPEHNADGFDDQGPPHMGPDFGDIMRGPRPMPQLGGTGPMRPGQMQAPGMDRGDRFNGNAFMGHPMFRGLQPRPMMGGMPQQLHGALGLNPGAMPMQADPGEAANMPAQPGMPPADIQATGAPAGYADGGSTDAYAGYTGLPADGGNSYWQAVKDRIGELIGPHHVGQGIAEKGAQQVAGRGKQIDDQVSQMDHAQGGEIMNPLQHFSGHGYVTGPGDGQSDDIPAKLSNGEYVISADVVSALGNGSNEMGANKLDAMMQNVRKSVAKNHAKGELQGKTKDPASYMVKGGK